MIKRTQSSSHIMRCLHEVKNEHSSAHHQISSQGLTKRNHEHDRYPTRRFQSGTEFLIYSYYTQHMYGDLRVLEADASVHHAVSETINWKKVSLTRCDLSLHPSPHHYPARWTSCSYD